MNLKRGWPALLLALILALSGCGYLDALSGSPEELVGQEAPELTLTSLDGREVYLSDFRGEIVLVNMWATWCDPCRRELPFVQELHERRSDEGLTVLAINVGQTEDQIEAFVADEGYTFTVLVDLQSRSMSAFNASGIPTVALIDREGVVRYARVGYGPGSDQELEEQVKALLAES